MATRSEGARQARGVPGQDTRAARNSEADVGAWAGKRAWDLLDHPVYRQTPNLAVWLFFARSVGTARLKLMDFDGDEMTFVAVGPSGSHVSCTRSVRRISAAMRTSLEETFEMYPRYLADARRDALAGSLRGIFGMCENSG